MLVITHNGIFHADEVVGNSSLLKWNNLSEIIMISEKEFLSSNKETKTNWINSNNLCIIRTRNQSILDWGLNNPKVIVMDNGGIFNTEMLNFDHHQNIALSASNMLIWESLFPKVETKLWEKMLPFMEGISDFDTNKDNINLEWSNYNTDHKFRNLSNIISGFNRDPRDEKLQNIQFKKAVEFAIQILDNEEYSAIESIKAEDIYDSREILDNNVAIFSEFCTIWKDKKEHNYAVLPNPQGWSLNSANSKDFPLPLIITEMDGSIEGAIYNDELIFAHKGRFIAVFKTKEAAIEVAKTL